MSTLISHQEFKVKLKSKYHAGLAQIASRDFCIIK